MSAKLRSKQKDRMNQSYLDSLIQFKEKNFDKEEVKEEPKKSKPILHSEEEYDTLNPEETFKNFNVLIRSMLARYESNRAELSRLENEMQDLLHFMEMGSDKNARTGYQLYHRMCEVRRERRSCKNEIDLLQPVYDMFHGTNLLDKLSQVQGSCHKMKQTIDNRQYCVRTDILSDFID